MDFPLYNQKLVESLTVEFKIELYSYIDYPVEYWEAKCSQLGLTASGKTVEEARNNLNMLIVKSKYNAK